MAYSLKKPCQFPRCPNLTDGQYCFEHKKQKAPDNRPNSYDRGYDSRWAQISAQIKREHPLCQRCGHNKSEEVHHIPDYVPGTDHEKYELVALCRHCHTLTKQSKNKVKTGNLDKLIIVYGPPGAGKTTYVLTHKRQDDIVIDFNRISCAITALPEHNHPANTVDYLNKAIDYLIQAALQRYINTYWITSMPKSEDRDTYIDMGATCILINTPRIDCQKRIMGDSTRINKQAWFGLIDRWFNQYEKNNRDVVVDGMGV